MRLIDADALKESVLNYDGFDINIWQVAEKIDAAPTVDKSITLGDLVGDSVIGLSGFLAYGDVVLEVYDKRGNERRDYEPDWVVSHVQSVVRIKANPPEEKDYLEKKSVEEGKRMKHYGDITRLHGDELKKTYLANIKPGTEFYFAGEKFVVLEHFNDETFAILTQSKEFCPFNDKDDAENRNDYTRSTLKERINKWVEALPRTSEEAAAILPFDVDLSCTDRSKSYGTITVKAAPLTLWQYGQFKELIPLNEGDWWWLVTPWTCRWLRSPHTNDTNGVWYVCSDGDYDGGYASGSGGIRPALALKSSFLVALNEDDEDECANEGDDGEDDMNIDLSKVGIAEPLSEIRRRVSDQTDGECEGDGE